MLAITPEACEFYTPPQLLYRVYKTFHVTLDPCSNKDHNVIADTYYTAEDDGLSKPWFGNVYVNPPYGRNLTKWVQKFCHEWDNNALDNAILFIPNKSDTKWYDMLQNRVTYTCAVRGRVKFINSYTGDDRTGTFASCFMLFSNDEEVKEKFIREFTPIGQIYVKYNQHLL